MKWFGFGLVALAVGLGAGSVASGAVLSQPALYGNGNHGPQGYLGVGVRDVTEENVSVLRLHEARGAEIVRVDHDGPAGKMGLREHDVVLQMNGTVIDGAETVHRLLQENGPGRAITLIVSRDGMQMTMTGALGDKGDVERQAWEQHLSQANAPGGPQAPSAGLPTGDTNFAPNAGSSAPAPRSHYGNSFLGSLLTSPTYTGVMLDVLGPQLAEFFAVPGGAGLLVRSVAANSPAAMAGLRAGDIVTKANLQPVGSPSRWAKTVRESKGKPNHPDRGA